MPHFLYCLLFSIEHVRRMPPYNEVKHRQYLREGNTMLPSAVLKVRISIQFGTAIESLTLTILFV